MGAGIVTLRRTRHQAGGELFDYAAFRTARRFTGARLVDEDRLSPTGRQLLDVLTALADRGAPCAGNAALGGAIGSKGTKAIIKALAELRDQGLIAIDRRVVRGAAERRMEIVETGASTGWGA